MTVERAIVFVRERDIIAFGRRTRSHGAHLLGVSLCRKLQVQDVQKSVMEKISVKFCEN